MAIASEAGIENAIARVSDLAERLRGHIAQQRIPGASLAIYDNGRMSNAEAGLANVEAGIAVDARTIFQIGSITKVFTATLTVMLAEANRLSLDAPVRTYLPELRLAGRPAPDSLTVRMLLDYSSGIAGEFFEDFGPAPEALAHYVAACADLPLLFAPGTMRAYSTTAYCIAGRVIEAVTGQFYEDALVNYLLKPLGLECYAFFTHDIARYRTAIGHGLDANGEFKAPERLRLPHCMSSSGASLTMSATDLLRFGLLHLNNGETLEGARLVSASATRSMATASRIVPPNNSELLMGWAALPSDRGRVIVASGATIEQNSFLVLLPERQFAMTILANCRGGAQRLLMSVGVELLQELADATVAFPKPPIIAAAQSQPSFNASRFVGHYTNHTRATIAFADGELVITITAKQPGSNTLDSQRMHLKMIDTNRFAGFVEGVEAPVAVFEFVFANGPERASHFVLGPSFFARCDEAGATAVAVA